MQQITCKSSDFFRQHGFLILRDFFNSNDQATIDGFANTIGEISHRHLAASTPEENHLIIVPEKENSSQVCRSEDMETSDPQRHRILLEQVTTAIADILGEPYVLFKDKINFKWPGGGAFTPHQDFPAYMHFPPRYHVTAMISVDTANQKMAACTQPKIGGATYLLNPMKKISMGTRYFLMTPRELPKIFTNSSYGSH